MGKRLAWKALAVTLAVSLIMSFCAVSAFADDGTQDEAEEGIARTQVDPSEEETASAEGESVEETVPESGDTESEIATETPEPEAVSQPEENLSEPEASQNAEATETDLQPADSDPQDGASIFDSINSTDSDEIVIEIDGDHALSAPLVNPENKHVIITSKTGAYGSRGWKSCGPFLLWRITLLRNFPSTGWNSVTACFTRSSPLCLFPYTKHLHMIMPPYGFTASASMFAPSA